MLHVPGMRGTLVSIHVKSVDQQSGGLMARERREKQILIVNKGMRVRSQRTPA